MGGRRGTLNNFLNSLVLGPSSGGFMDECLCKQIKKYNNSNNNNNNNNNKK